MGPLVHDELADLNDCETAQPGAQRGDRQLLVVGDRRPGFGRRRFPGGGPWHGPFGCGCVIGAGQEPHVSRPLAPLGCGRLGGGCLGRGCPGGGRLRGGRLRGRCLRGGCLGHGRLAGGGGGRLGGGGGGRLGGGGFGRRSVGRRLRCGVGPGRRRAGGGRHRGGARRCGGRGLFARLRLPGLCGLSGGRGRSGPGGLLIRARAGDLLLFGRLVLHPVGNQQNLADGCEHGAQRVRRCLLDPFADLREAHIRISP